MDYQKIYDDFIASRREMEGDLLASDEYREIHHIVPKSLGGADNRDNMIALTHRDHYFAHCCLAKIHGGGMWLALEMMSDWVSKTHGRSFAFTQSKLTSVARERYWQENRKWTKEALLAEAAKYESVSDFKNGSAGAYSVLLTKPFRDEALSALSRKIECSGHWDLKACIADASQYKTRNDWFKSSAVAYNKARNSGWMDQCTQHMESNKGWDKKKAVLNVCTGEVFDSLRSAAAAFGIKENAIGNVLSGRAKTSGGYVWEYI